MSRWPKNYKLKHPNRNYAKETEYENRPDQVARRVERNKDNREARRKGLIRKGGSQEVHHIGAKRTGSLSQYRTRVVSRRSNRRIQPRRS